MDGNIYGSNNSDISTGIIDPQNAPQKKNIHNDNSKKDGMVIENDFQDKKIDKTDPGQNDITKDNNNSIHIKYLGESTSLKTKILNIEDILYLEVKDVIKIHKDDTQYKFAKFEPAINPSKIIETIIKLSKLYFLVFVGLDFSFTLLFC